MRGVQRSITHSFAVITILVIAVALSAGYYTFYLDAKKTGKLLAITSFEECAKRYPVMESYPEQCNTPDGKHFTREINEEDNKKLEPITSIAEDWKIYISPKYKFSVEYPASWRLLEPSEGENDIYIVPPSHIITVEGSESFAPDSPFLGIRSMAESPFSETPKGNDSDFITDWKKVRVGNLLGTYYATHQCAPQCLTFVAFPYNNGVGTISVFISTVAKEKGYTELFDRMYRSFKYF